MEEILLAGMKYFFLFFSLSICLTSKSFDSFVFNEFNTSTFNNLDRPLNHKVSFFYQNSFLSNSIHDKGFSYQNNHASFIFHQQGNHKFGITNLKISYSKKLSPDLNIQTGFLVRFIQQLKYKTYLYPISPILSLNYSGIDKYFFSFTVDQTTLSKSYYPNTFHLLISKTFSKSVRVQSNSKISIHDKPLIALSLLLRLKKSFHFEFAILNQPIPISFGFQYTTNNRVKIGLFNKYHQQLNHSMGALISYSF